MDTATSERSMRTTHHICRRALPEDIPRTRPLWEPDRKLFDETVWCRLPSLLEELVRRELISFAIIESIPGRVPRLLGGISFVHAAYVTEARNSSSSLPNFMMAAALRGDRPFLTPKEIAKQNAHGTLNLLNLLGNIDTVDLSNPELANFYATSNEGFRFFHFGYNYSAMWHEASSAIQVAELQAQGMKIDRQRALTSGGVSTLMRLTAEDALANPYGRFCGLFFPPKPSFIFSNGESALLEQALLESSDEEAAAGMHLSLDAVKKRWRSIYRKVEMKEPEILRQAESGIVRRRKLLHYLRQHLEELRPFSQ